MKPIILYLVDDKEAARVANSRALKKLLASPEIEIKPIEPFQNFGDYDSLLANPSVRAFFIDQKMRGGGLVNYNGTDLAEYLRGHNRKLPIYILTGFASEKDQFAGSEYRVEDILEKEEIEDVDSERGKTIRARVLRRLWVFEDVLSEREQRFHDLLVKSIKQDLTSEEEKELGILEDARLLPMQAEDLKNAKVLEKAIEELKAKLRPDQLNLSE